MFGPVEFKVTLKWIFNPSGNFQMTVLYTTRISVLGNLQNSESFVKCSSLSFMSIRDYLTERGLQFSSVAQSCPTLCDPVDCSMPGLPVYHQLPEFTQTPVHHVSDAIQHLILCRPLLLLPSNLSQHQGLFK